MALYDTQRHHKRRYNNNVTIDTYPKTNFFNTGIHLRESQDQRKPQPPSCGFSLCSGLSPNKVGRKTLTLVRVGSIPTSPVKAGKTIASVGYYPVTQKCHHDSTAHLSKNANEDIKTWYVLLE